MRSKYVGYVISFLAIIRVVKCIERGGFSAGEKKHKAEFFETVSAVE